jgi:hypothetical protein
MVKKVQVFSTQNINKDKDLNKITNIKKIELRQIIKEEISKVQNILKKFGDLPFFSYIYNK